MCSFFDSKCVLKFGFRLIISRNCLYCANLKSKTFVTSKINGGVA